MKNRVFISVILIIGTLSQLSGQIKNVNIVGSFTGAFKISPDNIRYDILGTPYLNQQWMYGKLLLNDETKFEGLFRYNVFHQELEMIYNMDTLAISAPFFVKELYFSNKKFIYSLSIEQDFKQDYLTSAFFEVLYDGHCKLLLKHRVDIENNSYATTYMAGGGDGRDYYVHKSFYYYKQNPGGAAKKLRRKRREILNIFSDKKQEIEQFLTTNYINLKSDDDLVRVFEYYDSLTF